MKKNINTIAGLFLLVVFLFSGCSSGNKDKGAETPVDTVVVNQKDTIDQKKLEVIDFKFSMAYANLPSPFNVVNDLYQFKAPYQKELLNPVENASKYVKSFKKEVNFGVYGVDLAYRNFYGQEKGELDVYKLVHDFAKEMNIESVVNQYEDRYNSNSDNVDSLVRLVDNIYADVDSYLRESQRYNVASNIMAGSMVEVCYLSLNLIKGLSYDEKNAPLYEKIHNENLGIHYLIKLFEEYPDKDSRTLLADLKDYETRYGELIKSPQDLGGNNLDKAIANIGKLRNSITR